MLKLIGYSLMVVGTIIFCFRDSIDLQTYGEYHAGFNGLFFLLISYLLIASIIEIVNTVRKKKKNGIYNIIFIGLFFIFSLIIIFRPFNPKLMADYKETWVWKGTNRSVDIFEVFKVFNAYGRLKLSNNGRFVLNWRSLLNSSNHYGDWSTNGDTLLLNYHGDPQQRVGTKLVFNGNNLYSWDGKGIFLGYRIDFSRE